MDAIIIVEGHAPEAIIFGFSRCAELFPEGVGSLQMCEKVFTIKAGVTYGEDAGEGFTKSYANSTGGGLIIAHRRLDGEVCHTL